jgi:hypothetical protein
MPKNFMTDMTVDEAEAVKASNGKAYGEMSIEELYNALDAMLKRLERNHLNDAQKQELEKRISAIYLIFGAAKQQGGY